MFGESAAKIGDYGAKIDRAIVDQFIQQQPNFAAASPEMGDNGRDPLAPKPRAFDKDGKGWVIAGIIADAIAGGFGGKGGFAPAYQATQDANREERLYREKVAAERAERMDPRLEQVGNTIGWADPGASSYKPFYTAPQPFELYARSLGLKPGTPEYAEAVKEYRAGTWNDVGVDGRLIVQAPRLDVSRENNIRSTGTSRENSVRSTGQSNTNNLRSTGASRENSIRSTGQSNINNQRSTDTSRENNVRSNETRLNTSRRGRSATPVRVNSLEEARRLRPGTVFITPDGRTKIR